MAALNLLPTAYIYGSGPVGNLVLEHGIQYEIGEQTSDNVLTYSETTC